jgi:putative DNA primase/helicase
VDGAKLLDELSATIRTYMVIAVEAVHTVALWVLFTYLLDAFETSPRLAITAPQKRCIKTTLLSLLYQLTCRPLAAANLTPAVAFRAIEAAQPTLLIDETDTFVKDNDVSGPIVIRCGEPASWEFGDALPGLQFRKSRGHQVLWQLRCAAENSVRQWH